MSERETPKVVVMGVSGCGKSLTGTRLANELGVPFYDADDYHSRANVEKMAAGIPLTDDDRLGWLDDLAELIRREEGGLVLACSALKRIYRERLRGRNPETCFVYLRGDFETIWGRHSRRTDHYFNGRVMLESQFQLLEEPGPDENAVAVDVSGTPEEVVTRCLAGLGYDRHL
ncbi:MAG: gluconokinase [Marinobacter sp.]|nr:gluconokinase [Marinobacter sp.]